MLLFYFTFYIILFSLALLCTLRATSCIFTSSSKCGTTPPIQPIQPIQPILSRENLDYPNKEPTYYKTGPIVVSYKQELANLCRNENTTLYPIPSLDQSSGIFTQSCAISLYNKPP